MKEQHGRKTGTSLLLFLETSPFTEADDGPIPPSTAVLLRLGRSVTTGGVPEATAGDAATYRTKQARAHIMYMYVTSRDYYITTHFQITIQI